MGIFVPLRHDSASTAKSGKSERPERAKRALLWIAAVRSIAAIVGLALLPVLYQHDFLVLVALRPSLGILLVGAILARHGGMSLWAMLVIAVPLQVLIVWLYFLLGRAWQSEIHSDDKLPFLTARLLQRNQVRRIREALKAHGLRLVALARFAIFPTGLLAAAAGASDMRPARYFPADGLAFATAAGLVVGAGYGLGLAQRQSDLWLTVVGAAGLVALSGLLTWYVRRQPKQRTPRSGRKGR
jgi:membrane protein DedA with SNARE-associated domain